MKKLILVIVLTLVGYGIYDIVREVRGGYTTGYSRVYTRAAGLMMSPAFDSLGLSGKGIRIGVIDAGFGGFLTNRWTKSLRVGAYRDFTGGDDSAFFDDKEEHGTRVCTNIGGISGDTLHGLAFDALYFLAKSDRAEVAPRSEERNMIRGIEWLLSHGVDVISSSVAYTLFDDFDGYTSDMLDGRSSYVSHAVDSILEANPALIFVQSAGNEGNNKWKYIAFPADVRDVITVGTSDSDGCRRSHASGIGRDSAEYIKPDFVAPDSPPGSSFSTPVVTGLCACLLEYRRLERAPLLALMRASGSNAATPDCQIGYGVLQTAEILNRICDDE